MEAGEYEVQSYPQLHSDFQASAGYKTPFKYKYSSNFAFLSTLVIKRFTPKKESNAMEVYQASVWKSSQIVWWPNPTGKSVLLIHWLGL